MNFSKQTVVKHPETGAVVSVFTKTDEKGVERTFGTVRIDEVVLVIANGFNSKQSRTAFVTLDEDALSILTPHIKDGQPYPMEGKIAIKETFEPQWLDHKPKLNPTTMENILVDGKLVYRSSDFTSDLKQADVLLKSSNIGPNLDGVDEIDENDIS